MKLHEAIDKVLKESGHLMTINDIARAINQQGYYERNDRAVLQGSEILARIKQHNNRFENINGLIISTDNAPWGRILRAYQYIKETLRGIFSDPDIQFIVAVLLFYKRLQDINARPGRSYPIQASMEDFFSDANEWTKFSQEMDVLSIAPAGIFEEAAKLLSKLQTHKLREILAILRLVDTTSFNDIEYGNIYEYLLYQNSREHLGYEHSTPETIRLLLPELLNIRDGSTIYDPVSGLGGLLSRAFSQNKSISLHGSEINKRIAQLGNMNLMMYGYNNQEVITAENCFEEVNNQKKYDYLLGDLPLNGITNLIEYHMLYSHYNIQAPKSGKGFSALVLFSFYRLSEEGKAVVTVSDSFLTKGGKEKEVRNILLENDIIESVISLPRGTYRPYTEAKPSILILNKNKPFNLKKKIKFIKAIAIAENNKSLLLNIEEIVREYQTDTPNSKLTQIIQIEDIRDDQNLSAEVYDTQFSLGNQMLKEGSGKLLKDIAIIKPGRQPAKEELIPDGPIPVIKIENLTKDVLDINLNTQTVLSKTDYGNGNNNAIITQSCILIARIGETLKPTIFRPTPVEPAIFIHSGVSALIPKDETIDLEYLYYQLNSDFLEEQIALRRTGSLIRFLNKKELEEVIVPYADIQTQKAFKESQKANLVVAERNRVEKKLKALGYIEESKEAETNIVRTITHQLKHNLTEIDAFITKASEIIAQNNIGSLKEYKDDDPILITAEGFETPENYTLQQAIERVQKKSGILNQILTDVKKAIHLELVYTKVNIFDLLNELESDFEGIDIDVKGDKNIEIEVSQSDIKDMFNTLIINAIQHGDVKKEKLKISFSIKRELASVKIEYRNNGKPLNVSEDEFKAIATKSQSSSGTGVGGYYINKIIVAHKGILKITDTITTGVYMTIELPLNIDIHE